MCFVARELVAGSCIPHGDVARQGSRGDAIAGDRGAADLGMVADEAPYFPARRLPHEGSTVGLGPGDDARRRTIEIDGADGYPDPAQSVRPGPVAVFDDDLSAPIRRCEHSITRCERDVPGGALVRMCE